MKDKLALFSLFTPSGGNDNPPKTKTPVPPKAMLSTAAVVADAPVIIPKDAPTFGSKLPKPMRFSTMLVILPSSSIDSFLEDFECSNSLLIPFDIFERAKSISSKSSSSSSFSDSGLKASDITFMCTMASSKWGNAIFKLCCVFMTNFMND
ncbi:hypothetical protein BpHYR1_005469 [Brachionus plicatilis]|uniref:Uncharacterized protein n=1 Tax=Brachionus plicatilis TaxID=10195 RepID=A0A3M7S2W3_BRAPC|nr:hypothetical protein BpHYR1_005469 [Brachionus plicatilis]